MSLWDLVLASGGLPRAIMAILRSSRCFPGPSSFRSGLCSAACAPRIASFLRAFRKAANLEAVAMASEQFRRSPLVTVFDFGYSEVARQMKTRGSVTNPVALERTLQLGMSEELTRLERNMSLLATTATVSPFIGLFGTVWGIIDAFQQLGTAGAASLRAVAPGISEALITTALGLAAAIPAAIFYNMFGTAIKEFGARMEDFMLEFMNMLDRSFE